MTSKKSITYQKFQRIYSRKEAVKLKPSEDKYAVCYYQAPNTGEWFEYYHCRIKGFCFRESVSEADVLQLMTYKHKTQAKT